MEQEDSIGKKAVRPVGKVKLGYFATEYVREAIFDETEDLPRVVFSYKPLTMYQTAALTASVLSTESIETSTEDNLRMASLHITDWDLIKENPRFSVSVAKSSTAVEQEYVKVDFTNLEELKKVSPILMNFVLLTIRGDNCNPLMDKAALAEQVKNF